METRQRCLALKAIFGNTCSRRTFDNQATELLLACVALNQMTREHPISATIFF